MGFLLEGNNHTDRDNYPGSNDHNNPYPCQIGPTLAALNSLCSLDYHGRRGRVHVPSGIRDCESHRVSSSGGVLMCGVLNGGIGCAVPEVPLI